MSEPQAFTVIIPTLNRAKTLKSAIQTCTEQADDHFQILVSDNNSDDDTAAVVASFNDPRIKYINPGSRLGMSEHWEFALGHVQSGFVSVLGDDDGFLPDAVAKARALIETTGAKSLTWQKVEYHWPDHILPDYRNWLYIPLGAGSRRLNSAEIVKQVLNFRAAYNKLPCIYNSFISIELINTYRTGNDGVLFAGIAPDVYSAFAIASLEEEFLYSEEPLSINGASAKSNGTLQTQGKRDNAINKSFVEDTKLRFEPGIPSSRVIEFSVVDGFYKVQRRSPSFSREWVDNRRVIDSALYSAAAAIRSDEAYEDWVAAIRQFAANMDLSAHFEQSLASTGRNPELGKIPAPGIYPAPALVMDAASLGIQDVHACAARVEEILDLRRTKSQLFDSLAATKNPCVAIALFSRSRGAPVKLHLGCGYAYFEGYVNVDYPQAEHLVMTVKPDVSCDVLKIDLPEGVVEEVRLQHVFEHFNRTAALACLIKWQHWLRIGGKLHIETPDFEASALDFLKSAKLEDKLRAIRHLEGDQADAWAYHIGQWFPERFKKTFEHLGLENIEIRQESSCHQPPLFNVTAIGFKVAPRSRQVQYQAACGLLRDFMVAEAEQPTWEVWTRQLATALDLDEFPRPSISHPAPMQDAPKQTSHAFHPGPLTAASPAPPVEEGGGLKFPVLRQILDGIRFHSKRLSALWNWNE